MDELTSFGFRLRLISGHGSHRTCVVHRVDGYHGGEVVGFDSGQVQDGESDVFREERREGERRELMRVRRLLFRFQMYVPAILANWTVWPCTFHLVFFNCLSALPPSFETSLMLNPTERVSSSPQSSKSSTFDTCLSPIECPSSRRVEFCGRSSSFRPRLFVPPSSRCLPTSRSSRTDLLLASSF